MIRQAVEGDAEALQRYAADLFAEQLPTVLQPMEPPMMEEERAFLTRCIQAPASIVLVAEVDGVLVGMLDFHGYRHPQRQHAGVLGMSVAEGWRGQGLGTALLEALFRWAPQHGITRVELEVLATNPGAIRLYERLGFHHEGRRRGAVAVDGEQVDLCLMARTVGG